MKISRREFLKKFLAMAAAGTMSAAGVIAAGEVAPVEAEEEAPSPTQNRKQKEVDKSCVGCEANPVDCGYHSFSYCVCPRQSALYHNRTAPVRIWVNKKSKVIGYVEP